MPPGSVALLLQRVWNVLVSVLGATATAALVRRAARNAAAARPEVPSFASLDVVRDGFNYRVVVPETWQYEDAAAFDELRAWFQRALCPLLVEMTGPVLTGILARDPVLVPHGLLPLEEPPA